jgi:hypothetical protein
MNGSILSNWPRFDALRASALCPSCGMPKDFEHFDESSFADVPEIAREVVLARFELQPQYCGVFENFSQYTDQLARQLSQAETPGLQWLILVNNRPLYPYVRLEHVVNPWGYGSFPVSIRLDDSATVEFIVRNLRYSDSSATGIKRIGGRITGRYWYNPAYGDATPRACHFK